MCTDANTFWFGVIAMSAPTAKIAANPILNTYEFFVTISYDKYNQHMDLRFLTDFSLITIVR
jgi:hypothetical protein